MHVIEVIAVRDTRQFEEIGDRWVAIPGSGEARECDRCGRTHEIHAEVRYADQSTAIVGTGCMGLDSATARKHASGATRRAQARAELARAAARLERAEALYAAAEALQLPELKLGEALLGGKPVPTLECGDARVYLMHRDWSRPSDREERTRCVVGAWRHNRRVELAGAEPYVCKHAARQRFEDAQRRLDRLAG